MDTTTDTTEYLFEKMYHSDAGDIYYRWRCPPPEIGVHFSIKKEKFERAENGRDYISIISEVEVFV